MTMKPGRPSYLHDTPEMSAFVTVTRSAAVMSTVRPPAGTRVSVKSKRSAAFALRAGILSVGTVNETFHSADASEATPP